ncbi:uncharacterized protein LOC124928605 [Impatiens glandulifera]|uniref:uncharacterized protein LOC124928605 n=1 Tax=Impatiens glandulifera TaxID=253017 RepID=UPI001FB07C11|nr:uncharacterized protein LOC124928605 [Impatiens glandulifera]
MMMNSSSRRVSFSDFDIKYYDLPFDKKPATINNNPTKKKKKAVSTGGHHFWGSMVAKALRFVSNGKRSSRKVSSTEGNLARSRSYVDHAAAIIDSHRAEALEDCIEFLNSSSSSY